MSIRKNFTMSEEIVHNLEELARIMNKKQSQVIQELIVERMKQVIKEKKLQSLEKMSGMFSGLLPEHINMQWIKSQNGH